MTQQTATQCPVITEAGEQCKNRTRNENGHCFRHQVEARQFNDATMGDVVRALPKDGTPMRIHSPYGTYDMTYHGTFTYIEGDGWAAPAKVCPECGEDTHTATTHGDERADVCDACGWTNA